MCEWKTKWEDESVEQQTILRSRQGVPYVTCEGASVRDPETMEEVPNDGQTVGEIMFRGNTVMKGYFKNPVSLVVL
jgi:fatty-acyl-CoA synthase